MRNASLIILALLAALPAVSAAGGTNEELARQVRQAETAFAKTMSVRDHDSFAAHVAEEALFFSRQVGTFTSIWRRESDGRWRIVFDKGCPPCDPPPKAQ
jgi:ketosteroid isomerase-like protein